MWRWWHTRPCSSSQRWAAPRLCSVGSTEKWSRRTGREGPGPDRRAPHLPVRRWTSNRKIWNLKSWGNNSHINNDKRFMDWRDHKGHSTPWSHPLKDVLWKALMYADRLCTTQETADPQCISSEQKSRWATHWRNTCCYLLRELGSAFKQQQALRLLMPVWCVSPLFSAVGDTPRKRLNKNITSTDLEAAPVSTLVNCFQEARLMIQLHHHTAAALQITYQATTTAFWDLVK